MKKVPFNDNLIKCRGRIEIDPGCSAAYVYLGKRRRVAKTVPSPNCMVVVDFDAKGDIVGIEIVGLLLKPGASQIRPPGQ